MTINLTITFLIITIIGSLLIIMVKLFYKDEEEEEKNCKDSPTTTNHLEEAMKNSKTEKNGMATKISEEPMTLNHKNTIANDKDLFDEVATEKDYMSNREDIGMNKSIYISDKDIIITESEDSIRIVKNQTKPSKDVDDSDYPSKIVSDNINTKKSEIVIIDEKRYELKLKDDIIFEYNDESYSSQVLDIKHKNVKVMYRTKEKWITISDIKKIL